MSKCCNCNKEALLLPYVCSDCLKLIRIKQDENTQLREMLSKVQRLLERRGLTEEAKTIQFILNEKVTPCP